jgi:hypothetical protein
MAKAAKMEIRYQFKPVNEAAYEAVQEARELWMDTAQTTAQQKVDDFAATRGYNLSIGVGKERLGFQSARIFAAATSEKWGDDPWWVRFFEYGTVAIPAMPFMGPAARKANKVFVAYMGVELEGKIRRKSAGRWKKAIL